MSSNSMSGELAMGERKKLDLHTTQILADIKLGSSSEIKSIETGAPLVQFYETDAALIKAWSNYLAGAGDKGINTKKHLQQLERNLKARGFLPDSGRPTKEHCFPLAADRMLSLFIADDLPHNAPCKNAIGDAINLTAAGNGCTRRIFKKENCRLL
jgi:hypothetical protein